MPKALTQEKYLSKNGIVCPLCRSEMVEGGSVHIDGSGAWQKVTCTRCSATWNDLYDLVGYDSLADSGGNKVPEDLFFEKDIGYSHLPHGELVSAVYMRRYLSFVPTLHKIYMLNPDKLLELLNIWNGQSTDWKYYTKAE